MTPESLSHTLADLAPALKNHLWQSTLFLLAAALLTFALRHNHARTRHWLWLAASAKFLIPFSLLVTLGSHLATPRPVPPAQTTVYFAMEEVSQPFTIETTPIDIPTPAVTHSTHLLPIVLAAVWFTGFAVVLAIWFLYWRRITTILRASTPIHKGRELEILRRLESTFATPYSLFPTPSRIQLLASPSTLGPGIYGLTRPILIWPAAISQRLDDAHLESIFAHEICHVRRRDNLTAALHMLVEAIFWFHPLVWALGARLEAERERACDESVLENSAALTTQPHIYAESIVKICEFYIESPLPCVSGVTGADLKKRLTDILERHATLKLTLAKKLLLAIIGLTFIAIPILSGQAKTMQRLTTLIDTAPSLSLNSSAKAETEAQSETRSDASVTATPVATTGPTFEVATIRTANRDESRPSWGFDVTPSGRFTVSALSLNDLIGISYSGPRGTASDGPKWAESEYFDINAKVDDANTAGWDKLSQSQRMDLIRPMLQTLLAERFHLKLRTEMRDTPVYALGIAKGGSKLKPADLHTAIAAQQEENRAASDGAPKAPPGDYRLAGDVWTGNAVSMAVLASAIGNTGLPRRVVDETGLTGNYDFTFALSRDPVGPTISQQVEDQLGLTVEPRNVPIKTYVIVSADKPSLDGAELSNANTAQAAPHAGGQAAPAWMKDGPTSIPLGANGKPITFDIVSFRRTQTRGGYRVDLPETSDFVAFHGQPLSRVIGFAYLGVGPKLIGTPDWLDTELYDFQAKVAPEDVETWQKMNLNLKRLMVRAVLTDLLKLKVHANDTPENVYELVVAKGGPKLKEHVEGDNKKFPDGFVVTGTSLHWISPAATYFQREPLKNLADVLTTNHATDREVVDKTGLTALYDFTLPDNPLTPEMAAEFNAPSLATALLQYGLKLQPGKATYPGIVIDHVERPPDN